MRRPPLTWLKARARLLMRRYQLARRLAIYDAWRDHIAFLTTGAKP